MANELDTAAWLSGMMIPGNVVALSPHGFQNEQTLKLYIQKSRIKLTITLTHLQVRGWG